MKVCAARKCQSWVCLQMTQLQRPMGCHGHHAILCNPNRLIFREYKNFWYLVVQLNNFASMNNCPLVQLKSNKPPPPSRGVCVGGRNSYSMIYLYFYFHTHGYANDIILLYDYWMKGLVKLYH